MQELFTSEQFTGKQFLRVKIERRITILCEEHFHIGPQVHKMDRSISKLLEVRVKAEGLDEVTLMHGWILRYLYEHQEVYKDLEAKGAKLYGTMEEILKETGSPYQVNHVSSLGSIFFATEEVKDYTSAKASDTKKFAEYFLHMLKNGIHLAPSQFEAMFLSTAHSDAVIEETLDKVRAFFAK